MGIGPACRWCRPANQIASHFVAGFTTSADEVAFWKWQEYTVDPWIVFGTVQELRLEAGELLVRVICRF